MAVEAMGRGQWPWTVDVRGKGNQDVVERAVAPHQNCLYSSDHLYTIVSRAWVPVSDLNSWSVR